MYIPNLSVVCFFICLSYFIFYCALLLFCAQAWHGKTLSSRNDPIFFCSLHWRNLSLYNKITTTHFKQIRFWWKNVIKFRGKVYSNFFKFVQQLFFWVYSVALDESTDKTDTALAIFIRGINEQVEVTEELLSLCPMHGRTTAKDIFQQLCDAIERAGLPWSRLVGITTDGAPSMTGKKKWTGSAGTKKVRRGKCRSSSCSALHYTPAGTV